MDMRDLNIPSNLFINKAQIFDTTINTFIKELNVSVPYDLLQQYYHEFKWLTYKDNILHCIICQEAYARFPEELECDEWTVLTESSYKEINKSNLILILKIHDFSINHIHASELLNQVFDNDLDVEVNTSNLEWTNQGTSTVPYNFTSLNIPKRKIVTDSEYMILLRSFCMRHFENLSNNVSPIAVVDLIKEETSDCFEPLVNINPCYSSINSAYVNNFHPWGRYLTRYSWLYLKDDNPGCKYCEEAFKLSLQMSYTKWTSPNTLTENISQDRPNRTLLQHDRSKNHKIAEDVLIEHNIIDPRPNNIVKNEEIKNEPYLDNTFTSNLSHQDPEYPPEFTIERWDTFSKKYPWLYYQNHLFHCTYCEKAFELHRTRMTHTSWTSSQIDCGRIKDMCKARHYFYDHQRSNNHRVAKNILRMEGIISTKTSVADDDDYLDKLSNLDEDSRLLDACKELMRPSNVYEDTSDKLLNEKQWEHLSRKYPWLVGTMGMSYGCSACQLGRKANPLIVNLSQWTQGFLLFTKTKYIQLRKSLWCHSITRNHINSVAALQQSLTSSVNGDHSKLESVLAASDIE